jgi:hypothetical protein
MEWQEEWGELVKEMESNVNAWIQEAFEHFKSDAIELNKNQLSQGLTNEGKSLSPYSTPYKKVRVKYGRPTSPKDLNLTGEHYKGFYGKAEQNFFEMGSENWKANILQHNWGEIYGIPEEQIDEFLEQKIFPFVAQKFVELFQ